MRLLNIDTFRLESFQNADEAPPYAIFSHRWEEEEVIYDDLQEPLINQDFRVLQRRFEAMEKRFDGLMCRLEEQNPTKSTRPTFAQSEQSAPTLLRRNDSPVPLLQYQEHDAQDNWGRLGDLQPIANGSSNHLHESSTWDTEALRIDLEDAKSTSLLVASYPHLARAVMKKGWGKIVGCCREVRRLGMRYVWIDTCCIDQKSSSEVYESINSMFDWYRIAKLCLAYLSDVTDGLNTGDNDDIDTYIDRAVDSARTLRLTSSASQRRSLRGSGVNFNRSQWFHRGWTLQELIAPAEVWFYQYDWQLLGLRSSLAYRISCITDIDELILQKNGLLCLHSFSVATKMSWAAGRRTSRPEDRAYSLMGLFGINMPTLYGEGEEAAFFRLQTKIFQVFSDHSIFAWEPRYNRPEPYMNLFARSPDAFIHGASIETATYQDLGLADYLFSPTDSHISIPYSMFSHRMRIQLLIRPDGYDVAGNPTYQACLACKGQKDKRPFSIRVVMTELGQFKRLAAYTQREKDPDQLDPDDPRQARWTLTNVYIPSPQPSIAPRQSLKVHACDDLPIILEGSTLSHSGLYLKISSWPAVNIANSVDMSFKIDCSDWDMITRADSGDQICGALIFEDSKSSRTIGVALTVSDFRLHATFINHVRMSDFEQPFQARKLGICHWQEASTSMLSEELSDGRIVFVSSEDDFDKGVVRLRIGVRDKSQQVDKKHDTKVDLYSLFRYNINHTRSVSNQSLREVHTVARQDPFGQRPKSLPSAVLGTDSKHSLRSLVSEFNTMQRLKQLPVATDDDDISQDLATSLRRSE